MSAPALTPRPTAPTGRPTRPVQRAVPARTAPARTPARATPARATPARATPARATPARATPAARTGSARTGSGRTGSGRGQDVRTDARARVARMAAATVGATVGATALALPGTAPAAAPGAPRTRMRVLERPRTAGRRLGFAVSCTAVLGALMLGLLLLNVAISGNAFTVAELQSQRSVLVDREQALEHQILLDSAPAALAARARALGMVPAPQVVVLAPDGTGAPPAPPAP